MSGTESNSKQAAPKSWALQAGLVLILGGVAAFLYVLFAASSKPEPQGYARFAKGAMSSLAVMEAAPPLPVQPLKDAAGAETTLAAFEGQPMLVNFWATWCAPCMEEMPTLGALARRFEGRLAVVAVNLDAASDGEKAQRELARLSESSLAFLTEPTRKILFDAEARGMPTTILYDREGREIARLTGAADWDSPEAAALIEAALADS